MGIAILEKDAILERRLSGEATLPHRASNQRRPSLHTVAGLI